MSHSAVSAGRPAAAAAPGTADPFAGAKEKLLPPLRNRLLAEAAEALVANNVTAAETLVERHLAKKPNDPEALNLRADIARRLHRFEDAEQLLSRCLDISPQCVGYRYNYSIVLRRLHRYEEALLQIDKLLESDPGNPLFRDQKASILRWLGRHDEALVYNRELTEQYPTSPEAWLHYAHSLRNTGSQEQSISAFHRALELSPSMTGAYLSLADMKVYRFTEAEIENMEEQLRDSRAITETRADLHHALGKAYADTRDYAKSFENYAKGNALRRINVAYDQEKLIAYRSVFEAFFTEEFFRQRIGSGCASNAPIFIVGMPRSGSTLLEQILSSHSAIEGLGELPDLDTALLRPLAEAKEEIQLEQFANGNAVEKSSLVDAYIRIARRLLADDFRAVGAYYLEITGARRTTGRPYFSDKTLRNFFYVGLIHLILPSAKIIDARRHPLDCGWSCFRSQFPGHHYATRLSDIGHDYANYARLMAHFDRVLPGRIHRVIYEELVSDPEAVLRKLFAYLDLPFEEQCLRFYANTRPVMTQSSEQVRLPLYKSGVAQWKPYERWLGPLKAALGDVLDKYPSVPG